MSADRTAGLPATVHGRAVLDVLDDDRVLRFADPVQHFYEPGLWDDVPRQPFRNMRNGCRGNYGSQLGENAYTLLFRPHVGGALDGQVAT
jgi:hypothetical protein